jgi:hypothetical protein
MAAGLMDLWLRGHPLAAGAVLVCARKPRTRRRSLHRWWGLAALERFGDATLVSRAGAAQLLCHSPARRPWTRGMTGAGTGC